jgi:hypothetical protein
MLIISSLDEILFSCNGAVSYAVILELLRFNNTVSPVIIRSLAVSEDSN